MLDGLTWMIAVAALAAGSFVFIMSFSLIARRHEVAVRLFHLFMPEREHGTLVAMTLRFLEYAGRRIEGSRINRELRSLVQKAGLFQPSAVYIFVALRYLVAVVVALLILIFRYGADGITPVDFFLALLFGYLFYRYALIGLKVYGDRRANVIRGELPPVLDIMLMALDAGVSIDQCMRYVANITGNTAPVTSECLRRHIADIDAGMPYDAALDRLGQRLGVDEAQDLAATIKQALFQGGELGTTLRRFSADLTDKRLATAREQVGRKAPQLTMVMIIFFMPVLLIVLAGPAVVNLKGALRTAGQELATKGDIVK
jgi:tight adherence protein C